MSYKNQGRMIVVFKKDADPVVKKAFLDRYEHESVYDLHGNLMPDECLLRVPKGRENGYARLINSVYRSEIKRVVSNPTLDMNAIEAAYFG